MSADTATTAPVTSNVRAWAVANGIPVGSRGRIAADVVEQYKAANQG